MTIPRGCLRSGACAFVVVLFASTAQAHPHAVQTFPGVYESSIGSVTVWVVGEQVTSVHVTYNLPCGGSGQASTNTPAAITNESFSTSFSGSASACPLLMISGTFSGTTLTGSVGWSFHGNDGIFCFCDGFGSYGFTSAIRENLFANGFED